MKVIVLAMVLQISSIVIWVKVESWVPTRMSEWFEVDVTDSHVML